jgi:hypothetical protein
MCLIALNIRDIYVFALMKVKLKVKLRKYNTRKRNICRKEMLFFLLCDVAATWFSGFLRWLTDKNLKQEETFLFDR